MKEFKTPSITSVLVLGSLWWGAIAAAAIAAAQPVVAAFALAGAVAQLWGAFKFAGSNDEAELRSSVAGLNEQQAAEDDAKAA